jgi:hypothetical protein
MKRNNKIYRKYSKSSKLTWIVINSLLYKVRKIIHVFYANLWLLLRSANTNYTWYYFKVNS